MSTDDFETTLRARLADLADREDDWDDPAPVAREIAAAGIAPDDDPAIVSLAAARARRRRWWPTLAVAATLLAFVVGGGLGVRELVRGGTANQGTADSAAGGFAAAPEDASTGGTGSADGADGAGGAGGRGVAPCADLGPAESTGPLAGNGSIRPGGIVGPRVASGAATDIPVVLSFAAAGPTVELRAPEVVLVEDGRLVGAGGLSSDLAQRFDVTAGFVDSGSVTFQAARCDGPLPAGDYEIAVIYPYTAPGTSGLSYLVSAPLLAVVS